MPWAILPAQEVTLYLIDRLPWLPFQLSIGDWVAVQWIDACGVQICSMTRKEVRTREKPGSPTLKELKRNGVQPLSG